MNILRGDSGRSSSAACDVRSMFPSHQAVAGHVEGIGDRPWFSRNTKRRRKGHQRPHESRPQGATTLASDTQDMDQGFISLDSTFTCHSYLFCVSFLRPRPFSTTVSVDADTTQCDAMQAPRHVLRDRVLVLVTDKRKARPIEQDEGEGIHGPREP
jgi:hypothetical protein